ncbi:phosphatase PAP2 family protein [Dactylosporangium sp. NPDC000244]|uniref:phosphatase PAP2 family protein n=1 Tax=Dactylosporangium sp. NPDC000244 TaxID=3154365 RepID=UPI00331AA722
MAADRRVVAVVLPLGFAALTALVAVRFGPLLRLDTALSDAALRFARSHHVWRAVMSAITHSADQRVLLPALLLAVAFAVWRRDRAGVVFLLAAAATATVLRLTVLTLVHRPRPPERLTAAAGWAFPSGHTTSATIAAGILVVLLWPLLPSGRARAVLAAVAGLWAGLVGISRVALAAHWPTDVLGGWLLAGSVLTVLGIVLRPRPRDSVRPQPSGSPPGGDGP